MEKYTIDRIEGEFAVLEKEDGTTKDVKISLIKDCQEGDAVVFQNGQYTVDKEETLRRKKNIEEKMKRLFNRK